MKETLRSQRSDKLWIFLLVSFDFGTKYFATRYLLVERNSGVALGFFGELGQMFVLVGIISLLLVLKNLGKEERILIVSGAVGNLIDRIDGGVIDWILLPKTNLWFNVADIYLVIGILLAGVRELKRND